MSATATLTVEETGTIRHAALQTLSLSLLEQSSPSEIAKLVAASRTPGFFYLDFSSKPEYAAALDTLYREAKKYFDQSREAKLADFHETVDRGYVFSEAYILCHSCPSNNNFSYKPYDDCETLEIAREDALTTHAGIPSSMRPSAETLQYFIAASHHITLTMLTALSKSMNQPQLLDAHTDAPNDCGLKFESVPMEERLEDVPPSEHTDMGTLTLLFCPEYTTELRVPGTTKPNERWEFIEPRQGCAIVNVADSLQRLTSGQLMSSLHRVGQPHPGAAERFCMLYYLRPDSQ